MKFIHTSDLHLGKNLSVDSLFLQHDMLQYILDIIAREGADYLVITGDIFDSKIVGTPLNKNDFLDRQLIDLGAGQEIDMFVAFLEAVKKLQCKTIISVGNHDPEKWDPRICKIVERYTTKEKKKLATDISGYDEFGKYRFIVLPLVYSYSSQGTEKKIGEILDKLNDKPDYSIRNILVGHLYVCKSEEYIDTLNNGFFAINANIFNNFDYVALGHTHRSMSFSDEGKIQYSGSPIDYSELESSRVNRRIAYDEYSEQYINIITLLGKGTKPIIKSEQLPNFCTVEYIEYGFNYQTKTGEWRNTLEDRREDYAKFFVRKDDNK